MTVSALPPVPRSAPPPDAPKAIEQGGPGAFHAAVETASREDAADKAPAAEARPEDQAAASAEPPATAAKPDRPADTGDAVPAIPASTPGKAVLTAEVVVRPPLQTVVDVAVDPTTVPPDAATASDAAAGQDPVPARRKAASATDAGARATVQDATLANPAAMPQPVPSAPVLPASAAQHAAKAAGDAMADAAAGGGADAPAAASTAAHGPVTAEPQAAAQKADAALPSVQFAQTLEAGMSRPGALPYDANARAEAAATATASVTVREGQFGRDMGVAIARALEPGPHGLRDALLVRLDPRDMGRIEVHMAFEGDGTLRATVSADSPAALDLLRRESTQLDRALNDAGVRADSQSLRFESSGGGTNRQHQPGSQARPPMGQTPAGAFADGAEVIQPQFRSLRSSGHLDLLA